MEPKVPGEVRTQNSEIRFDHVMALPSAEFMGQIPEFAADGSSQQHPLQTRIVYDSSLELAQLPITQPGLQELLRYSIGATTNYAGLTPKGTVPTGDLLREMFEKYKLSKTPLTIVLAHGEVDGKGELVIRAAGGTYPFETYRSAIEKKDEKRRKDQGLGDAPSVILLASSTTEDQNFSIPPNSKSIVYYRKGIVGILPGTGSFTKSR